MNCICDVKLKESEYKECGFYYGDKKLNFDNAFLFSRDTEGALTVKSFLVSGGFVVNDKYGVGCYFDSTIKGAEFKGIDKSGNLVNIEDWVLNNAVDVGGASRFLGLESCP